MFIFSSFYSFGNYKFMLFAYISIGVYQIYKSSFFSMLTFCLSYLMQFSQGFLLIFWVLFYFQNFNKIFSIKKVEGSGGKHYWGKTLYKIYLESKIYWNVHCYLLVVYDPESGTLQEYLMTCRKQNKKQLQPQPVWVSWLEHCPVDR